MLGKRRRKERERAAEAATDSYIYTFRGFSISRFVECSASSLSANNVGESARGFVSVRSWSARELRVVRPACLVPGLCARSPRKSRSPRAVPDIAEHTPAICRAATTSDIVRTRAQLPWVRFFSRRTRWHTTRRPTVAVAVAARCFASDACGSSCLGALTLSWGRELSRVLCRRYPFSLSPFFLLTHAYERLYTWWRARSHKQRRRPW